MVHRSEVTVTLTEEVMLAIGARVRSGEFASADEAIKDALRVWMMHPVEEGDGLVRIQSRIRRSLADPRPDISGDDVDAQLDALFASAKMRPDDAPA